MTGGEKIPGEASPTYRGKAFFIVTTALIIALFTGGIAYGVQTVIGDGGEPEEGVFVDGQRKFDITVQQWYFEPAVIKVNPGDNVSFNLTGKDVWHGFAINELGINLTIHGNETMTKEVVIPADLTEGSYTMYCSVFCGLGHPYLKGRIIVGEPKLFLGIGLGRALPYVATLAMAVIFAAVVVIGGRRVR